MRTTIDIADDVLQAAKERARLENKTAGDVVSELLRGALTMLRDVPSREPKTTYGFKPFTRRGSIITNEMIDRLRDDDVY